MNDHLVSLTRISTYHLCNHWSPLRNLDGEFETEGDLVPTPEDQVLLRKMRTEKLTKDKGKASVQEQVEKEAQLRAKKRLRREKLELK